MLQSPSDIVVLIGLFLLAVGNTVGPIIALSLVPEHERGKVGTAYGFLDMLFHAAEVLPFRASRSICTDLNSNIYVCTQCVSVDY